GVGDGGDALQVTLDGRDENVSVEARVPRAGRGARVEAGREGLGAGGGEVGGQVDLGLVPASLLHKLSVRRGPGKAEHAGGDPPKPIAAKGHGLPFIAECLSLPARSGDLDHGTRIECPQVVHNRNVPPRNRPPGRRSRVSRGTIPAGKVESKTGGEA